MPIDPRIPLGGQAPQSISPADLVNFKDMLNRNKLQQLELEAATAQRNLYSNPENFKAGMPTDNALQTYGQQGGNVLGLQNELLRRQQAQSIVERNQAATRRTEELAKREEMERYASSILPVGRATMLKYNDLVRRKVPMDEAIRQSQEFYAEQLNDLERGGMISPKLLDEAKRTKFNPYLFQARVTQFSQFLGEKDVDREAPKTRELKKGDKIVTQEWSPSTREWTDVSTAPRKVATPGSDGSPTSSAGLPKGVIEYVDLKTNKRYGVGKGLAYELDDKGAWKKVIPSQVPQKIVKVGSAAAGMGAREAVFTQRMFQAANQASKDLENIANSPISVTSGLLGSIKPHYVNSYLDAGKTALANTLTPQDVQIYNAKAAGLQRTLAAIEAAGLMPSGQLVHQMDAVIFRPGDTQYTKLHKLAQARQIIESGVEVMNANPRVSEDEKDLGKKVVERTRKSIPFTHQDLDHLAQTQQKNPKATMRQLLDQKKKEADKAGVKLEGDKPGAGGPKNFSKFWSSRGSASPANVKQGEDPDDDSDDDKE